MAAQELKKIVVQIIISVYEIMSVNRDYNKIQWREKDVLIVREDFILFRLFIVVRSFVQVEEKSFGIFVSPENFPFPTK